MDILVNSPSRYRAHPGRASAMIGKPAVAGVENAWDAGQLRSGMERPGPPDLPGEIDDGFGTAINFSSRCGDAHFAQEVLLRQGEQGLHAWVLQRGETEAARFQGAAEATGQRGADGAIAVEEDPTAEGMLSFCISHF